MKRIWKRFSATVVAPAVLLTAVVFEVPGDPVAVALDDKQIARI